ncbi:hypothetical protein C8J57DRAFT_326200 [Mycena rebaudengoi]|nr:hypothetical protein C8J57DRAFT_326200 [Mycena rebaudengoi]
MWVRRRGGCGVPRSASGCSGGLTPGALDLGPSSISRSSSAYPSFISTAFKAYTLRRAEAARLRFRAYPPGACSIARVLSWRCVGFLSYIFAPHAQHRIDTIPPTEQFGFYSCLVVHPRLPLRHLSIPSLLPFCSFAAPSHPLHPPLRPPRSRSQIPDPSIPVLPILRPAALIIAPLLLSPLFLVSSRVCRPHRGCTIASRDTSPSGRPRVLEAEAVFPSPAAGAESRDSGNDMMTWPLSLSICISLACRNVFYYYYSFLSCMWAWTVSCAVSG